ncbi:MAG: 6,7-dimethyl-8-ribityllumazine synthase, partial [Paracoccaceae bacterium]
MTKPSLDSKRIAFIQACWHRDIVDQLRDSFATEFASLSNLTIDFFELPGAYEIPLHAKTLAETGKYAGIVAAG